MGVSVSPSASPSSSPSRSPSLSPSVSPSGSPSVSPSRSPSSSPSVSPSESPSLSPSASVSPSGSPSISPSSSPSESPSASPSAMVVSFLCNLPLIKASFSGYQYTASLSVILPLTEVSITGVTGEIGIFSGKLPLVGVEVNAIAHRQGRLSLSLPLINVNFDGYAGVVGSVAVPLPLIAAFFEANRDSVGSFSFDLPLVIPTFLGVQIPITYNRKAIVMNLNNHAVTEYKNFNFNSLISFNGVILGMSETGLYILDGDNDLGIPIESYIQTGMYDLGEGAIKIPKEVWLSYRSDSDMDIEVTEDEKNVYNHTLDKVAVGIRESRAKLGKGLKGRFYRFGIRNKSGSDFDIQSFRALAQIIGRKAR